MHRMHRIFSGNGWLVILGIRKPAPDHRRSQLPAQQPLVLFILCILCIDVHKKNRFPGADPAPPRFCIPLQGGEIPPGARASRPHAFSFIEAAERQREFAGSHYVGSNRSDQAEGEPWRRCQSIQVGGGWPRLCQAWCGRDARAPGGGGRDARAPGGPSSCGRDARAPGGPSLCGRDARAPRGIPFGRCVPLKQLHIASWPFVSLRGYLFFIRVHSWFVFISCRLFRLFFDSSDLDEGGRRERDAERSPPTRCKTRPAGVLPTKGQKVPPGSPSWSCW